jgi:Uma2 family endonuclease
LKQVRAAKLRNGLHPIRDVEIFHGPEPPEVPDYPPLVAIEILSPDDRLEAVAEKLEEFRAWGVAHTWAVDPMAKRFYNYDGRISEVGQLRIPELGIDLEPAPIFE